MLDFTITVAGFFAALLAFLSVFIGRKSLEEISGFMRSKKQFIEEMNDVDERNLLRSSYEFYMRWIKNRIFKAFIVLSVVLAIANTWNASFEDESKYSDFVANFVTKISFAQAAKILNEKRSQKSLNDKCSLSVSSVNDIESFSNILHRGSSQLNSFNDVRSYPYGIAAFSIVTDLVVYIITFAIAAVALYASLGTTIHLIRLVAAKIGSITIIIILNTLIALVFPIVIVNVVLFTIVFIILNLSGGDYLFPQKFLSPGLQSLIGQIAQARLSPIVVIQMANIIVLMLMISPHLSAHPPSLIGGIITIINSFSIFFVTLFDILFNGESVDNFEITIFSLAIFFDYVFSFSFIFVMVAVALISRHAGARAALANAIDNVCEQKNGPLIAISSAVALLVGTLKTLIAN